MWIRTLAFLCFLFGGIVSPVMVGAQDALPNSTVLDASGRVPKPLLDQVRASIARLDTRNTPVYLFVGSEVVPFAEYQEVATAKSATHHLVLGIVWNNQANGYGPISAMRDELDGDLLLTNGETAFYQAFQQACNGCTSMTGAQAGEVLRTAVQAMLSELVLDEALSASGAMNHFRRHQKYLPLDPQLTAQIEQFGQRLSTHLDKWETARRIYTSAEAADTFTYAEYRQRVNAFAQAMETEIADFKQDFEQSSLFPGMYLLGKDSRYSNQQYVHLRQLGSYVGNPMYYKRAHDMMRAVLSTGKLRAALKEFAAVENSVAYWQLYDLYIWLGEEDWLSFDQGGKPGDRRSVQRENNNYKFNTLADFGGEIVGVDIGFANLSANHKHELFLLQFDHNFLPLKYDMYVACSSAYASTSLGASRDAAPGLDALPSTIGVMPQGDNINNASRSHIFHFPANYFAGGTAYSYMGASTGADVGPANYTYVLAGDMTFSKGGLDFVIGTSGHNVTLTGSNKEVGVTILESSAGAGGCYGTLIHNFTGLPQTLTDEPTQVMSPDSTRFSAYMLPMVESQNGLSPLNKQYLDRVVEDLKALHQHFPTQGATVRLLGGAAGVWSKSGSPATFAGKTADLTGLDAAAYLNMSTVNTMVAAAQSYLATELGKTNIPQGKYLVVAESAFRAPQAHQQFVGRNMGGEYIEVLTEPTGWRLVLATVTAEL